MSKSIEAQVTGEAPEEAFGYRLEVPGNKPHSTKVVPRPTRSQRAERTPVFWRLRPFQTPTGIGEGTFRVRYCTSEGTEVEPREGTALPVVKIAWGGAAAPPPPLTPAAPPVLPTRDLDIELADKERTLAYEDKEQESNLKVGTIGHRLSLLRSDRAHRDLVTESAEREMATAGRVSSLTQQIAVGHLQLVDAVNKLAQQVTAPPPVVMTDWGKPLTTLIESVTAFGVAILARGGEDEDRPRRLAGKKRPAETTDEEGEDPSPAAGDPGADAAAADTASTVPTGAETYAAFAGAHLTEEERRRMDEAMRDPERVREFLRRIRKEEEAPHGQP